ncbi:MAG: hypothetical protein H6Q74_928 [Firmicutes bacterium]|nr:hypothetical protein [Bacillota bacterium]
MPDVEELIKDRFVPFRQKVIQTLKTKYPFILTAIEGVLSTKNNSIGLQVVDNGAVVGEFTFHLSGLNIETTECGSITPEFHHPFLGVIKPYIVVEKTALEIAISDDGFSREPLATLSRYLPNMTFKFMS